MSFSTKVYFHNLETHAKSDQIINYLSHQLKFILSVEVPSLFSLLISCHVRLLNEQSELWIN